MIFRLLLLIQICWSLSQAVIPTETEAVIPMATETLNLSQYEKFKLNLYDSHTLVFLNFRPRHQWELCECEGGKCKPKKDAGAELCQKIQQRFEVKADPNQYLMFCELVPMTCTRQQKPVPDFVRVRIVLDSWYLEMSPFYNGGNTCPRVFPQLLKSGTYGTSILAENMTVEVGLTKGTISMPLEFMGKLYVPDTDAEKYYYCTTETCINTVNQFCREVVEAMRISNPELMRHFKGCTVRRIYPVDEHLGIHWSIMVDYNAMISAGRLTTKQDIENQMQIIKKNMTNVNLLKSFEPIRIVPLDYCDIKAITVTNQKHHPDMIIPVTSRYKTTSTKYYSDMVQQLMAGEDQQPSCFRNALEVQLFKQESSVRVHIRLFYSLSCYKQRGVNSCEDVTAQVASIWNKGSRILPSEMGTNYTFQLLASGLPLN